MSIVRSAIRYGFTYAHACYRTIVCSQYVPISEQAHIVPIAPSSTAHYLDKSEFILPSDYPFHILHVYVSKFSHTQSIQIIIYKSNNFSSSSISLPISISISRILAIISDVGGYSTGTYSTSLYLLILRS